MSPERIVRHACVPAALALLAASAAACSDDDSTAPPSNPTMPTLAEASAATKQVLALTASYTGWSKFTENPSLRQSAMHKNMFVVSYYNQVVGQALSQNKLPLADGAIIVKENWAKNSDPALPDTGRSAQAGG